MRAIGIPKTFSPSLFTFLTVFIILMEPVWAQTFFRCGHRQASGFHVRQDLGGIPDKAGAQGTKEVVLDRLVSPLRGANVHFQQVFAEDRPMLLLKEANQFLVQGIDLESRFFLGRTFPDHEAQDQHRSGHGPAFETHAHTGPKAASEFEGCWAIQSIELTKPGEHGLRSRVALIKKSRCCFNRIHDFPPSVGVKQQYGTGVCPWQSSQGQA